MTLSLLKLPRPTARPTARPSARLTARQDLTSNQHVQLHAIYVLLVFYFKGKQTWSSIAKETKADSNLHQNPRDQARPLQVPRAKQKQFGLRPELDQAPSVSMYQEQEKQLQVTPMVEQNSIVHFPCSLHVECRYWTIAAHLHKNNASVIGHCPKCVWALTAVAL